MTRPVGGRELERALERLAAAERDVFPVADPPVRRFRRLGPCLVEERYLGALLAGRLRGRPRAAPPRLTETGAGRLLRARLFARPVRARCRAQVLLAKSHLRAFYLAPEPLTLKLVEPCARDALAREVAVRSALAVPCAPRLVAQRLDGPHPHLCEQLLFGRHPDPARDGERVVSFVLDELWQSYRASGFEWRRCAESHDLAALLANFDAMAAAASRRSPWPGPPALRGALERLGSEADRLVPWCLGHGDLSLGNLLLCEGRVRALDWERARRLPLLHELAKISVTVPGSWGPIVARIGQEFPNVPAPGMASPAAQGALAALERLAELRTRFDATSPDAVASPREAVRFRRRLKAELGHLARLMLPETA